MKIKKTMKTKTLLIILGLLFTNITFAQQKVAIYVTGGNDSGINKVLGDKLVEAFVKSGKYTAMERTSSFLAELQKENQNISSANDIELSRLGKQFGVQLVCVAEVSEVFGEKYVSARLIDVENGEVITTSNSGTLPLKTMPDLIALSEKLANELSGKTGKELYAEKEQQEYQTQIDNQNAKIEAENLRKEQERTQAQEELGKSIAEAGYTIASLLGGVIVLENHDKDPFDVFINGKFEITIQGKATIQKQVPRGNYRIEVFEKSGYVLHRQTETFNVRINKGETKICRWD